MSNKDDVEFCATQKAQGDFCILFTDGENEFWIPKSQIRKMRQIGKGADYELTIPEWLAIKKGII